MSDELLKKISEQLKKTQLAKDRNSLLINAKQNMLMVALLSRAPPEEVERARSELVDALVAGVDSSIEAYREAIALTEE